MNIWEVITKPVVAVAGLGAALIGLGAAIIGFGAAITSLEIAEINSWTAEINKGTAEINRETAEIKERTTSSATSDSSPSDRAADAGDVDDATVVGSDSSPKDGVRKRRE